jgi:hypothetical protein
MAEKFVLTAQLHLQAPTNVKQVMSQIQNQLKGTSVDVQLTNAKQTISQLKKTSTAIKKIEKDASKAATNMDKLGKAFGSTLKYIVRYDIARRVFGLFANAIEQGTQDAIAFEREMVKVAQVTGKSMAQLQGLTRTIGNLATGMGVSSASLVKVSRVLSQTGMTAKEVEVALKSLAKTDLAPTFDNITNTTETAIAAMRQFKLESKDLERVLGQINVVAANFAVEAADIGAAIKRAGGAFASAGGSVEEFIALFTSVRSTTRETAETIATGMRTIFTRIQRPKTIKFLRQFGIELQDLSGKFVGPYEAVEKLHKALKGLDPKDVRYSMIIEQLGGFRQVSKVIPLIQQFSTAQKAMNVQAKGGGSLAKDAQKAQQSLAIQIQKLTENVKELFRNITGSKAFQVMAKGALMLANAVVKIADSIAPVLPLLIAFAGVKIAKWGVGKIASGDSDALGGVGNARPYGPGPQGANRGGKILGFKRGGWVPGSGNGDTVPAMLEPGEFVIRKSSAQKMGGKMEGINKYATGGAIHGDYPSTKKLIHSDDDTNAPYRSLKKDGDRLNNNHWINVKGQNKRHEQPEFEEYLTSNEKQFTPKTIALIAHMSKNSGEMWERFEKALGATGLGDPAGGVAPLDFPKKHAEAKFQAKGDKGRGNRKGNTELSMLAKGVLARSPAGQGYGQGWRGDTVTSHHPNNPTQMSGIITGYEERIKKAGSVDALKTTKHTAASVKKAKSRDSASTVAIGQEYQDTNKIIAAMAEGGRMDQEKGSWNRTDEEQLAHSNKSKREEAAAYKRGELGKRQLRDRPPMGHGEPDNYRGSGKADHPSWHGESKHDEWRTVKNLDPNKQHGKQGFSMGTQAMQYRAIEPMEKDGELSFKSFVDPKGAGHWASSKNIPWDGPPHNDTEYSKKLTVDGQYLEKKASGGPTGTDTVPALLTPGEFVINKKSAQAVGYGKLKEINAYANGGFVQKFGSGGTPRGTGGRDTNFPSLEYSNEELDEFLNDMSASGPIMEGFIKNIEAAGYTLDQTTVGVTRFKEVMDVMQKDQPEDVDLNQEMSQENWEEANKHATDAMIHYADWINSEIQARGSFGQLATSQKTSSAGAQKTYAMAGTGDEKSGAGVLGSMEKVFPKAMARLALSADESTAFIKAFSRSQSQGATQAESLNRALESVGTSTVEFENKLHKLPPEVEETVTKFQKFKSAIKDAPDKITKAASSFVNGSKSFGKSLMRGADKMSEVAGAATIAYVKFAATAEAVNQFANVVGLGGAVTEGFIHSVGQATGTMAAFEAATEQMKKTGLADSLEAIGTKAEDAGTAISEWSAELGKGKEGIKGFLGGLAGKAGGLGGKLVGGAGQLAGQMQGNMEAMGQFGVGGKMGRAGLQGRKDVEAAAKAEQQMSGGMGDKIRAAQEKAKSGGTLSGLEQAQVVKGEKHDAVMAKGKAGGKASGKAKMVGAAIQFAAAAAQKIGGAMEKEGMAEAEAGRGTGMQAAAGRAIKMGGQGAQMGAAFGPLGAAAGLAAGAIVGFITGLRDAKQAIRKAKLGQALSGVSSAMEKFEQGLIGPAEAASNLQQGFDAIDSYQAESAGGLTGSDAGNTAVSVGGGVLAGAAIGAAVGTIVPVIGTAIGAAVGAVVGGVVGLVAQWAGPDMEALAGDYAENMNEMKEHLLKFKEGLISSSKSIGEFENKFGASNLARMAHETGQTVAQLKEEIKLEIDERNKVRTAMEEMAEATIKATRELNSMRQIGSVFDGMTASMEQWDAKLAGMGGGLTGQSQIGSIGAAISDDRMMDRDTSSVERFNDTIDALSNVAGEGMSGLGQFAEEAKGAAVLQRELGRAFTLARDSIIQFSQNASGDLAVDDGAFSAAVFDMIPTDILGDVPEHMQNAVRANIDNMVTAEGGMENIKKKIAEDPDKLVQEVTSGYKNSIEAYQKAAVMQDAQNTRLAGAYAQRSQMELAFVKSLQGLSAKRFAIENQFAEDLGMDEGPSIAEAKAQDTKQRNISLTRMKDPALGASLVGKGPKEIGNAMADLRDQINEKNKEMAEQGKDKAPGASTDGLATSQKDLLDSTAKLKADYDNLSGVLKSYAASQNELIAINKQLKDAQKQEQGMRGLMFDRSYGTDEEKAEANKKINAIAIAKEYGIDAVAPELQRSVAQFIQGSMVGGEAFVNKDMEAKGGAMGMQRNPDGSLKGITGPSDKRRELAERKKEINETGLAADEALASEEGGRLADFSNAIETMHADFLSKLQTMLNEAAMRDSAEREKKAKLEADKAQGIVSLFDTEVGEKLGMDAGDMANLSFNGETGGDAMESIVQGGYMERIADKQNVQAKMKSGGALGAALMSDDPIASQMLEARRWGSTKGKAGMGNKIAQQLGISEEDARAMGSDAGDDTNVAESGQLGWETMEKVLARMGQQFEDMGIKGVTGEGMIEQFRERLKSSKESGVGFEADDFLDQMLGQARAAAETSSTLTQEEKEAQAALTQAGADISLANEALMKYLDERRKELGVGNYDPVDMDKQRTTVTDKRAEEKEEVDTQAKLKKQNVKNEADAAARTTQNEAEAQAVEGGNQNAIQDSLASTTPSVPGAPGVPNVSNIAVTGSDMGGFSNFEDEPISMGNKPKPVASAALDQATAAMEAGETAAAVTSTPEAALLNASAPLASVDGDTLNTVASSAGSMAKGAAPVFSMAKGAAPVVSTDSMEAAKKSAPVKTGTGEKIAGIDEDLKAREEQQGRFKAQMAKGQAAKEAYLQSPLGTTRSAFGGGPAHDRALNQSFRGAAGQGEEMLAGQIEKGGGEIGDIKKSKEQLVQQKIFEDAMINVGLGGEKGAGTTGAIKTGTDNIVAQLKVMETIMGTEAESTEGAQGANDGWADPEEAKRQKAKGKQATRRNEESSDFASMYGYQPELTTSALTTKAIEEQQQAQKKAEESGSTQFQGSHGEAWTTPDDQWGAGNESPSAGAQSAGAPTIQERISGMGGGGGGGDESVGKYLQEHVDKLGEIFGNALQVEVGGTIDVNVNMNGAEALNGAQDAFGKLAGEKATAAINNFIDSMSQAGTGRPQKKGDWAGGGDNGG